MIAPLATGFSRQGGAGTNKPMSVRRRLDDGQMARVLAILDELRGAGRPGKDDKNFLEAVLWWHRTGVPWRDLPSEFGPWSTVFNRFDRWSKSGKWQQVLDALKTDIDSEWHSLDSTVNRAHQHAAGGKGGPSRRRLDAPAEALRPKFTSSSMRSGSPWSSR